jgi:GMP synthase (glutamine-hydrolysing)
MTADQTLLVIKTGTKPASLARHAGDYEDWILDGTGWPRGAAQVVAVHHGGTLPPATHVAGAVITGAATMVTDGDAWIAATAAWLRDAVISGLPVLGICYGHQLLAHALGGAAGWNPNGVEVGVVDIELLAGAASDPLLGGLPTTFPACVSHRQSALLLPPGAALLARSALEPHHAFRVGNAWGVQFHPEFDVAVMPAYIAGFREVLLAQSRSPDDLLAALRPTPASAAVLRRFAAVVRDGIPV